MSISWAGAALMILLGYLCGSISFSYLAGRLVRQIDLRQYGGGKLSGSNVYHQIGFLGMVVVGLLDIAKAAGPTWLCLRLGYTLGVAVLTGLAAMAGHSWSVFLGFQGGRGIATALGTLLVIFPRGTMWLLGSILIGRLVPHAAAVPALLGFTSLPLVAAITHQPEATIWGCWGMLVLVVLKRLEGNRRPITEDKKRVLLRRLLLDRDLVDFDAWIAQRPQEKS